MSKLQSLRKELRAFAEPEKAKQLQRFFKTGPGEYGEGDVFMGITVPAIRKVAKRHADLSFSEAAQLISSKMHEERLAALLLLAHRFEGADEGEQKKIYEFYLAHTDRINNWDLVDLSAHKIVGAYLLGRDRSVLKKLARSKSLWERRIAIVATFAFIRENQFEDTLRLAEIVLHDEHDLIHKAVGWMLREIGKRDLAKEEEFLREWYQEMPRTMLRYAIERFPEKKRQQYLRGKI